MSDLSDIRSLADMIKESAGRSIDSLESLRTDGSTDEYPLSAILSAKVFVDGVSHVLWEQRNEMQKFAAALEFLRNNTPQLA